jgi:GT2 family glycosyltransferase
MSASLINGWIDTNMSHSLPLIVIPIFNAYDHLGLCLAALQRNVPEDAEIVLIDDASTDIRILPMLKAWQKNAGLRCQILQNEQNQGFVATANMGMALADDDVVLLNSDTEVTTGWLQRLSNCLNSDHNIATATPWSNNGEIVSIPTFCQANPPPPDPQAVALTIARCGVPGYPSMPTAVGFCMAISQRALQIVGGFDEATFGRGYGEENDFCQRAEKAGLKNVLCDDAYVIHHGGASFSPLGLKPDEHSMQRLLNKHPDYQEKVSEFIQQDPFKARRQEILDDLKRALVVMR